MRNPVENAHLLQKKINDLQLENQILKNILDRACVSYTHEFARISKPEDVEEYDPDQGDGLFIQCRLWMKWRIYFMPDSGAAGCLCEEKREERDRGSGILYAMS